MICAQISRITRQFTIYLSKFNYSTIWPILFRYSSTTFIFTLLLGYFHLSFHHSLFQGLNKFSQQPCWLRVRELFEFDVLVHAFVYFSKLHRAIIKAYSPARFDIWRAFLPSKGKELSISRRKRFSHRFRFVHGAVRAWYHRTLGQVRISSRTFPRNKNSLLQSVCSILKYLILYTGGKGIMVTSFVRR